MKFHSEVLLLFDLGNSGKRFMVIEERGNEEFNAID